MYSKHREAIERLYEDRVTISRYCETTKPSGETVLSADPTAIYSDQPCRISQSALGKNNQSEAQNDIRYESKLFISLELELLQGDVIEVTRGRNTEAGWEPTAQARTYVAGEPFPYSTHQEVSLQRKEYA